MRRPWTCGGWPRAAWSSSLALVAGCGGSSGPAHTPQPALPPVGPLPRLHAGEPCPVSPLHRAVHTFGAGLGSGPAYPVGTFRRGAVLELQRPAQFGSRRWGGEKVLWVEQPGAPQGLVIAGRRVGGSQEVRFDSGDVPPGRLAMPAPLRDRWVDRPSYTRLSVPGCYAYVVRAPGVRRVIVFRAVAIAHWGTSGERVLGRSAETMERALVEPRGNRDTDIPVAADCRPPTSGEHRRQPFGRSRRVFSCAITDSAGQARYAVQFLANGCYVAERMRRGRAVYGCR